jgi:putative alpha-1,2-mannosidase
VPFEQAGISHRGKKKHGVFEGEGEVLAGYVTFARKTRVVDVRIGVSFISIEQART